MPCRTGGSWNPGYTLKISSLLINHGHRNHVLGGPTYVGSIVCRVAIVMRTAGRVLFAPRPRSNLYRGGALAAVGALDLGTIQENKVAV